VDFKDNNKYSYRSLQLRAAKRKGAAKKKIDTALNFAIRRRNGKQRMM
jgi:hypothetical protein